MPAVPDQREIRQIVERALAEDLPDITTEAIFQPQERGGARLVAKESGIVAGLGFAEAVFLSLDPSARFHQLRPDGSAVAPGETISELEATVRALLSGERAALNLLQRASGIATATRRYVEAVRGTRAGIYDTRKTAPGLRVLDKYAVTVGGGINHRQGLHDMFLIKNNHIDRVGSLRKAVERVRASGKAARVMVEVRSLEELEEALQAGPDSILLDNMDLPTLRLAVRRTAARVPLEASGGVTLENVREIAETGVDRISIGALTHSVRALDISLRIENAGR
jgi:nicotinate-nucleotide pyrophosphorylase (carboxylating)